MSLTSIITATAETTSETTIHPWAIGVTAFVILLAMLVALLMFGAGRDHS